MASYTKKLIEVAVPLQAINAGSAREKSIRHGHRSTLHHCWARAPLPAGLCLKMATNGWRTRASAAPQKRTWPSGRRGGGHDHPPITSRHEPDKYILAIVEVDGGFAREPRYVRGALSQHEPAFEHTAIQFSLKNLLERAEAPA